VFKTLFLFLALLVVAHAQSVRWEPDSGTLAFNQPSQLRLVFEQCDVEGPITLPEIPGLTISPQPGRSESTSFTVSNGNASRSRTVTYSFRVRPTERLNIVIPSFKITTDKGDVTVPSATFSIGDATVGESSVPLDNIVQSRISGPSSSVWAGEVFPLTYTINAAKRYLYQLGSEPEWNPSPFTIEPWPANPEQVDAVINNDPRVSLIYKTRAYAKSPGTVTINSVSQLVNLTTGTSGFTFFSRPTLEQRIVTAPASTLTVKPLPTPAPAGFSGAVGQFTLDSKVVPATASVGEPITWTLTLDGTGNWPDIAGLPARSVSKDFRVVQPQAKRVNKNDALFDASITEDIVLIPTKPGTYTLGPVAFTVFNPATGTYQNLSTQPVTLTVGGPPLASSTTSDPLNVQPSALNVERSAAPSTSTIGTLPRDPLPPASAVIAPLSRRTLFIALLSSVLLPLLVWTLLALRRARRTDPALPLREARIRLSTTLRSLADSGKVAQASSLLQSWQRDTALLFQLPEAVPTPASFQKAGLSRHSPQDDGGWSALWSEADRTLYGNTPLPSDWVARAASALAAKPVPAFSAFQLFLPRNLLPLLALILFLLPGGRTAVSAAATPSDGRDAYVAADYPAAEKTWRAALASAPTDWSARHNLALALIQQNRPGEAAAHALAAYVQNPGNDSVRRTLAYAYKSAALTSPPVTQHSTLNTQLASFASPTRWQIVLIASAWLGAAATALGIHAAYKRSASGLKLKLSTSTAMALTAIAFALAASLSLHTYGPLADVRTVVVATPTTLRSIPTDLDTQKTTPLSLGVIATADKTFLGWTRLRFPDGHTGWTRTETLVALWR
jgi:tetratricopeptide (TPR) repeat protein